ncbi:hypothetical protein ACT91Q_07855, partial [Brevibacillus thermoruber]|uniref:hypothetical protein n=1 Tax=Brevibacillus thermoruber TaxID=33942 RepID=UPI004041B805
CRTFATISHSAFESQDLFSINLRDRFSHFVIAHRRQGIIYHIAKTKSRVILKVFLCQKRVVTKGMSPPVRGGDTVPLPQLPYEKGTLILTPGWRRRRAF